jgi:hypothetical protein
MGFLTQDDVPAGKAAEMARRPRTQCRSNRVSSESLPKTGIFAVVAGDFSRNGRRVLQFGSSETGAKLQKARQKRAFLAFERFYLWLRDCLAGAGGFEPPHGGIKIHCLTTWRRPNNLSGKRRDDSRADSLWQRTVYRGS